MEDNLWIACVRCMLFKKFQHLTVCFVISRAKELWAGIYHDKLCLVGYILYINYRIRLLFNTGMAL